MPALQDIETLLNRATRSVLGAEDVTGRTIEVAKIGDGVHLLGGILPYFRRAIGVPGRLLIPEVTYQPVLAVKEGDRITPLAYAEDVIGHPLREVLVGQLEVLSPKPS